MSIFKGYVVLATITATEQGPKDAKGRLIFLPDQKIEVRFGWFPRVTPKSRAKALELYRKIKVRAESSEGALQDVRFVKVKHRPNLKTRFRSLEGRLLKETSS